MNLPWTYPTWSRFLASSREDRLAHALLLTGPEGSGKRQLAQEMVDWLLCAEPGEQACGKCISCRLKAGGAHPDRFVLEPPEGKFIIKVDQVRELIAQTSLTTTISPRKVVLLVPAEAMNESAANALLKNLEEPTGHTILILVSDDPARLPVTIRSRCQGLAIHPPSDSEALEWLQQESGCTSNDARLALEAGGSGPLKALEFVNSGQAEHFNQLRALLLRLLGKPHAAGQCTGMVLNLEIADVWSWLSLNTAAALRSALTGQSAGWLQEAPRLDAARLARLQQRADRNRRVATSPVRGDLLLQEWLLEWARLPGARDA